MHSLLQGAFLLSAVFYFLVIILVYRGLKRLKYIQWSRQTPYISTVIAAKNEASGIRDTLKALEKLHYPQDRFEIIIVDDGSTDQTPDIIEKFAEKWPNWKRIRLDAQHDKYHAKKVALAAGISQARGSIIFTTDADCIPPADWLNRMVGCFDDHTDMVLGYSPLKLESKGFFKRLLHFDNLFSAIVSAAPTMLGFPISSVGRNLAFKKSAYDQVGGYLALTRFRSGDDIHLTERMRARTKGKIVYCADPATFVETRPPSSGKAIFYQQIRKNSKILDKSLPTAALSVLLFFAFLLIYTLPLLQPSWLGIWLIVMGTKFVLEYGALYRAARIFRQSKLALFIPVMQIIYPFYVIFFGLTGVFHLYRWKG